MNTVEKNGCQPMSVENLPVLGRSEILDLLSDLQFAAYLVLVRCCFETLGGKDISALEGINKPMVYTEDLLDRGWNDKEAVNCMFVLLQKELIYLDDFDSVTRCSKGIYLTDHWRNLANFLPDLANSDHRLDSTEI